MRSRSRFSLSISVVLAGLSLASCGQSDEPPSKAEYEQGFRAAIAELNRATEDIPDFSASASPEEAADATQRVADGMDTLAERLDGLNPPPDIAEGHERFVDLIESFADLSQNFSDLLRDGDPKALADYRAAGSPRAAPPGPYPVTKYITPTPSVIAGARLFGTQAEEGDYDLGEDIETVPGVNP